MEFRSLAVSNLRTDRWMTDTVRAAALTDTAAAMIDRPPSRSRLPQRRLPPTQEPRPRPGPSQHGRLRMTPELVKFHLATTDQFSVAVDSQTCRSDEPPDVTNVEVSAPATSSATRRRTSYPGDSSQPLRSRANKFPKLPCQPCRCDDSSCDGRPMAGQH